ncbi:major facilitator superfamily domain-containing protein [Pseudomassariella vexata]|uniref:Major facilitator superfamily domain-containing protein n=1 Tax=Pseudomassariella vexata TaxID=1141098 RepID=A0A1Y2D9J5_9PEZI|nr:major facilitator superfamily domain-containing protein [Pseudomassariella vexata]ORY55929.1 major facilitator superfamily domain-containing protein [Pseudomassariella vexata]
MKRNESDIEMRSHTGTADRHTRDKQDAAPTRDLERHALTPVPEYASGIKFWLALATLCLGIFLVTLDSTIVATAIPCITDEFHSLKYFGCYGSIYLVALCMSQLVFGKPTARYSFRWIYTEAMFVFVAGSAICGAAPNSPARAIAGLGSSGLLIIAYSLVPSLASPEKRALSLSLISMALLESFTPFSDLIKTLDLIGLAALLPSIVCLLSALQWGGVSYPWSDGRIIALLAVFAVLGVAFLVIQFWQREKALLPSRIFAQRSISCTKAVDAITLIGGGALISKFGHADIWMVVGTVFGSVSSDLFTAFTTDTSTGKWIGYQINRLILQDIPVGSSMVMLHKLWADVDASTVTNSGIAGLSRGLSGDSLQALLGVINKALMDSWHLPIVLTCMA